MVGHVLDPGDLVIVGQDDGIAGFGQPAHLGGPFGEVTALVLLLAGDLTCATYTLNEHMPTIAHLPGIASSEVQLHPEWQRRRSRFRPRMRDEVEKGQCH